MRTFRLHQLKTVRCFYGQMRAYRQKAAFWRGGTSKGVMIAGADLAQWKLLRSRYPDAITDLKDCAILLEPMYRVMMGSPDPYGRQLNGMGGGVSSLSKAVVVDRSSSSEADIDYLFIQIGIRDGKLDLAGNCGNMTSAVAPFALDSGLLSSMGQQLCSTSGNSVDPQGQKMKVRLRNLNTNKIIVAKIATIREDGDDKISYQSQGDYVLDGVSGRGSSVNLAFLAPGGAKTGKALPTGNVVDTIEYKPGQTIRASLLDISNPGVFIDGRDVGWSSDRSPVDLDNDKVLMDKLELIRKRGAEMMGLDSEALSMQQAHKAVPMTLGLNLGVACSMKGTIPHDLAKHDSHNLGTVVRHPTGKVEVGANIAPSGHINSAQVIRTARMLMEGHVNTTSTE